MANYILCSGLSPNPCTIFKTQAIKDLRGYSELDNSALPRVSKLNFASVYAYSFAKHLIFISVL